MESFQFVLFNELISHRLFAYSFSADDELFVSNTEYSVLWELAGIGSGASSLQENSWRSWIPETSLASIGFGLARLVCSMPIPTLVLSRVATLTDLVTQMSQSAHACSVPLVAQSASVSSTLLDEYEHRLNADMSDALFMAWQCIRNVLVLLKVSIDML